MLSVNSYHKQYVNDCRAKVKLLLSTYREVLSAKPAAAIKAFEPHFSAIRSEPRRQRNGLMFRCHLCMGPRRRS
jgi:hypothetical protein